MGGFGPFPSQTAQWDKERTEREKQDGIDGTLPKVDRDSIELLSGQDLVRFAKFIDRSTLNDHLSGLTEIAQKLGGIEHELGKLTFDIKFNGGLMKILPAIKRWQEGFHEEIERVQQLSSSLPQKSKKIEAPQTKEVPVHASINTLPTDGKLAPGLNILRNNGDGRLIALLLDPSGEVSSGIIDSQTTELRLETTTLAAEIIPSGGQGGVGYRLKVGKNGADSWSRSIVTQLHPRAPDELS